MTSIVWQQSLPLSLRPLESSEYPWHVHNYANELVAGGGAKVGVKVAGKVGYTWNTEETFSAVRKRKSEEQANKIR